MSIVLISPFSNMMRNGAQNAKNYPYWQELIVKLKKFAEINEIIQIGIGNEYRFEGVVHRFNQPLKEVEKLVRNVDVWISVDNFLPHLCNAQKVPTRGVVLFSRSDPAHFGYKHNINLLKDRKYLRPDQFIIWEQCPYVEDAYVDTQTVINAVFDIIKPKPPMMITGTTH